MTAFPYKKITIALAATMLVTFVLAALSFSLIGDKPHLSEEKRLEYEWQICDLERDLGYPACFIDGEFVQVKNLDESGRISP